MNSNLLYPFLRASRETFLVHCKSDNLASRSLKPKMLQPITDQGSTTSQTRGQHSKRPLEEHFWKVM
jgi:hypothetical protein